MSKWSQTKHKAKKRLDFILLPRLYFYSWGIVNGLCWWQIPPLSFVLLLLLKGHWGCRPAFCNCFLLILEWRYYSEQRSRTSFQLPLDVFDGHQASALFVSPRNCHFSKLLETKEKKYRPVSLLPEGTSVPWCRGIPAMAWISLASFCCFYEEKLQFGERFAQIVKGSGAPGCLVEAGAQGPLPLSTMCPEWALQLQGKEDG